MLSWVFRALPRIQTPMSPGSLKVLPHWSVPQYLCVQVAIFGHPGSLQGPLLSPWCSSDLDTARPVCHKATTISLRRLSYIFLKVEVEGQPVWPTLYHLQDWCLLPRYLLRLTLSGSRPWRMDTLCISLCPMAYCFPKNPKCSCKSISMSFSTRPAARKAWPLRTSITPSQAESGLLLNFVYTRFDWYYNLSTICSDFCKDISWFLCSSLWYLS